MTPQDQQDSTEKSKSQVKKELLEITELGEHLLEIPASLLAKLPLSENCLKAIKEGQKINHHTGKKRQIKYIGKILRDEDLDGIREELAIADQYHQLEVRKQHLLEQWRDRLMAEGDTATFELLQLEPSLDRQQLRQMVRNAKKEKELNKAPKFQRELFRYLRDNMQFSEEG
ncbi:ribosome biogenesis factor YjgA [Kangiella sp. M94]